MRRSVLPALLVLIACATAPAREPSAADLRALREPAIVGEIDEKTAARLAVALLFHEDDSAITIRINSPGGLFDAAQDIVDRIRAVAQSGVQVTCVVEKAQSAAFYILQACPRRVAHRKAALMIHEVYYLAGKWGPLTIKHLAQLREDIEADTAKVARLCAAHMGMSVAAFRAKIADKDWDMSAQEALAAGALDEVIP